MKSVVYSVKESKSGKSDLLALKVEVEQETPFGTAKATKFFNIALTKGTCKLAEGEEIDLDLSQFDERVLIGDNGNPSFWLQPKIG